MRALVDTSIWSLALRRKARRLNQAEQKLARELIELVKEGRAAIIGAIRQEMLSGIREPKVFDRLRERLRAFRDETVTMDDYEEAARFSNRCRAVGVTGSPTDFLICAVAARLQLSVFTTDKDFPRYSKHIPIRLHVVRPGKE